jgi:hypothetical protein
MPSSKALYCGGFQDTVAINVARYRPLVGHDRTMSVRSQGDKTDREGRDRGVDGHAEAVHGHNASLVYATSYT